MQNLNLSSGLHEPAIKIPHPLECMRHRPYRPKWVPQTDRHASAANTSSRPQVEGWHSPTIHVAEDGGAVRTNFTYRNGATNTSASFGVKPRRIQYTEGPHEKRYLRCLETDSRIVDYQFQIARFEWRTAAGSTRSYTIDGGWQDENGDISFFEVKAHRGYFDVPDFRDTLVEVEAELARHGIGFEKITGEALADPIKTAMVDAVYLDRRTPITESHCEMARDSIERESGVVALGRLQEQLDHNPRHAEAIANALLVRRVIGFALEKPVTRDTQVHRPRTLQPGKRTLRNLKFEMGDERL